MKRLIKPKGLLGKFEIQICVVMCDS